MSDPDFRASATAGILTKIAEDAHAAGLAEGERRGLERAAAWCDRKAVERRVLVEQMSNKMTELRVRYHLHAEAVYADSAEAIRALIKEPTT